MRLVKNMQAAAARASAFTMASPSHRTNCERHMDRVGIKSETARLLFDKDALHFYCALAIQPELVA